MYSDRRTICMGGDFYRLDMMGGRSLVLMVCCLDIGHRYFRSRVMRG
jgi:hypothetical protein